MSKFEYAYQEQQDVITANNLNNPFSELKDNTDGTSGKIDADNVRTEGINRNHFAPDVINNEFNKNNTAVNVTYNSETWVTVKTLTVSGDPSLISGEVFRCGFHPLIGATTEGAVSDATRATAIFYFKIAITINTGGGDSDIDITPPFGHGLIASGGGNGPTDDGITTFYERAPIAAVYIPRVTTTIKAVKLLTRIEEDVHSYDVTQCHAWCLVARN